MMDITPGSTVPDRYTVLIMAMIGHATPIARLLGLDIRLPDFDQSESAYWAEVHANGGYKARLIGKVVDPWLDGDPDWVLLLLFEWGEAWFDLESGIKFFFDVKNLASAIRFIRDLEAAGLNFKPGEGGCFVEITPQIYQGGLVERVAPILADGKVAVNNENLWYFEESDPPRSHSQLKLDPVAAACLRSIQGRPNLV